MLRFRSVDNKGCIKLADFCASKQVVELVCTVSYPSPFTYVLYLTSVCFVNWFNSTFCDYCRQQFLVPSLWRVLFIGWLLKSFSRRAIIYKDNNYHLGFFFSSFIPSGIGWEFLDWVYCLIMENKNNLICDDWLCLLHLC